MSQELLQYLNPAALLPIYKHKNHLKPKEESGCVNGLYVNRQKIMFFSWSIFKARIKGRCFVLTYLNVMKESYKRDSPAHTMSQHVQEQIFHPQLL